MKATQRHGQIRRGITLTEILISILIMGIGVTSIMTLFLYGMVNSRLASRYSRSAQLVHSAGNDIATRNLLTKQSFQHYKSGIYYNDSAYTPWPYDPWLQDTASYGADPIAGPTFGVYRGNGSFDTTNAAPHDKAPPLDYITGPGLPVAYDPLWRTAANYFPGAASEARFASGIGFVRPDPNPGSGAGASANPSAHGLQRITNVPAGSATNVPEIFVSPEDVVLQSEAGTKSASGALSLIVPDLTVGGLHPVTNMPVPQHDWKYTWMFTGYQTTSDNVSAFEGDMVVFENRPFGVEPVTPPFAATPAVTTGVTGETVVEAVFGYTGSVKVGATGASLGYGTNSGNGVLLRWPDTQVDPEVKVGNWIADVTYERNAAVDYKRSVTDPDTGNAGTRYPYQRCYWYLVAKRTQAGPGQKFAGDPAGVNYREMTVWTTGKLKAFTMLRSTGDAATNGSPYHVNAALVSPYVVGVYPRAFVSH